MAFFCIICQKSLHLYNRFKCEAMVQGDLQGITTLVGRRLGKTLTIKLRVWDLPMFTNNTQEQKRCQKMIDLFSLLVSSLHFKLTCFFNQL